MAVSVGGIDALQMDVVAPGATLPKPGLRCLAEGLDRLWLGRGNGCACTCSTSHGGSARILAIAISAPESEFERVVEAATPIVDSIEFHTP